MAATEAGGLRVDPMAQQTRSNAIAPRNEQPQQPPPSLSASASASPYPSPSVSAASQQRVAHLAGSQRGHNSTLLITALGTGNRQSAVGNRRPTTARRSAPGTDCSTSSSKNGPGSARVSTWIRARAEITPNMRRGHSATNKYAPIVRRTVLKTLIDNCVICRYLFINIYSELSNDLGRSSRYGYGLHVL